MSFKVVRNITAAATCILAVSAAISADLKHPDWHPNGNQLVAEGSCAGGIDLYLIDLERGRVYLVWDGGLTEGYPRWFSDGTRIAFHQIDDNRNSKLFVAELSRNGEFSAGVAISDGPFDIEPVPSPSGSMVAFSQRGENGQDIAIIDLLSDAGGRVWKTDNSAQFPSWHPDGGSIIFYTKSSNGTHIYQRELESDRLTAVTTSDGPNFVGHFDSRGDRLVYSSERDGDREVYLHDFATGTDRRMTDRPGRDGYPKISPNGLNIAYHSVISETSTAIRVIDMQGAEVGEFSCDDWESSP